MVKKGKKKKKFPWLLILIIIAAAIILLRLFSKDKKEETSFETTELSLMDIESIVSSTGTLAAVGTVEVSTQVSGRIDSILVDFNDNVSENQILAILDRTTLELTYRDAKAKVERAKSQYELLQTKHENDSILFAKELISEYDHQSSEDALISAKTNLTSAEISLEKADKNLNEYAIIKSPIDGIVISREIEEGQTVQASMSAPTLFILAEDLTNMEIEALVDESDIGMIEEGQVIRFTVEAFSDDEFSGIVEQVRMQPTVVSDVVHYSVICSADNSNGKLLPGMTATVEFTIAQRNQVMALPNSAFNVKMPVSYLEKLKEKMGQNQKSGKRPGSSMKKVNSDNIGRIWYFDGNDLPQMTIIKKGLSDGINTEITLIKEIPDKSRIITKVNSDEETASLPQHPGGMMRGGPGLF